MAREDERKRRSSYFPNVALNKGYSLDPRFTGVLQPSPTGSYYNPTRYAGFSQPELNRIQGNLATNYTQDLEFNRLANPRFQTGQDTGYSSTAPFGSGRASAATTQNYAQTYGTPTGNGLSTFQTPSGGSITYRPSGRQLSGGLPGGGAQPFNPLQQSDISNAYSQGYGTPSPTIQQGPGGPYRISGGVANPISNPPNFFQRQASNLYTGLTTAFPAIAQGLFGGGQAAYAGQGAGNQYANPGENATPTATPNTGPDSQYFAYNTTPAPRRYFDY